MISMWRRPRNPRNPGRERQAVSDIPKEASLRLSFRGRRAIRRNRWRWRYIPQKTTNFTLEARKGLGRPGASVTVSPTFVSERLDAADHVAHFAAIQRFLGLASGVKQPTQTSYLLFFMTKFLALADAPVHHTEVYDDAAVGIITASNMRAQGSPRSPFGGGLRMTASGTSSVPMPFSRWQLFSEESGR